MNLAYLNANLNKTFKLSTLGLIALLGGFSGQILAQTKALDKVAVIVDDSIITQSELDKRVSLVAKQMQSQGVSIPNQATFKRQVADKMILERIQAKHAQNLGITIDDAALNEAIETIAKHNQLTLPQLKVAVQKDGLSYAEFKDNIRMELLLSKLHQREIVPNIHVSDQEIATFMSMPQSIDMMSARFKLNHILVALPANPSANDIQKAQDKANALISNLRSGQDFLKASTQESKDKFALSGGDLGWRTIEEMPSIFVGVAPKMRIGEIQGPIRSPSGFHIVKLVDKQKIEEKVPQIQQTKVRHILIKTDAITSDASVKLRLQEIKSQIEHGKKFEELARMHSADHASAVKGGDLGWVTNDGLVPEFVQVMNKVKPNTVSAPFKSQYGWHILEVEGRRFEKNEENLRKEKALSALRGRKFEDKLITWLQQLRADANVEILANLEGN